LNSRNRKVGKARTGEIEDISNFSSLNDSFERGEDWIETQATPTGYIKHPLEQILEWLDRAMFWIEELFVKVWRWWQRLRGRN